MNQNVIVIDIGGTHIKMGSVIAGQVSEHTQQWSTDEIRNTFVAQSLVNLVTQFLSVLEDVKPDLVVVTVPGLLNSAKDQVVKSGNVPQLNNYPLAQELEQLLQCPVKLERDTVLALYGDIRNINNGNAKCVDNGGGKHVLGLYFGTGVGGAMVSHGKASLGTGWAMELGYIPFIRHNQTNLTSTSIDPNESPDILENHVSGRVLVEIARKYAVAIEEVFVKASIKANNATSSGLSAAISQFIHDMAQAIGIAVTIASPDTLVLGGGVVQMAGFPKDELIQLILRQTPFMAERNSGLAGLRIVYSDLGWRSNLYQYKFGLALPIIIQTYKESFYEIHDWL